MPRRKPTTTKPKEETTDLAIRVTGHEARVNARVNHDAYQPQYAMNLDDNDPLYDFRNEVTITGTATWPEDRAGQAFELTLYGDDAPSSRTDLRLRDIHARNKHGSLQYRTYRGREVPVFAPPRGMGILDKVRGEPRWRGAIFVARRLVTDALILLRQKRPLYIALDERRIERTRWIRRFHLQTTDPAEE